MEQFVNQLHSPIDAVQLAKIEGVHRGFLYQHLYAVACLLTIDQWKGSRLVVEHDEDVQADLGDNWAYFQLKYRASGALSPSDLKGVLERFELIRSRHQAGERPGQPRFYVVANVAPSAVLSETMESWPDDVIYVHPHSPHGLAGLPSPCSDLGEAIVACTSLASTVPYSRLVPRTLVDRLVAHVMLLATGSGGGGSHEVQRKELPELFDQFLAQLHYLPAEPEVIRPTGNDIGMDFGRLSIFEGQPGLGKTTWAGQVVRHAPRVAVYFDAAQAPRGGHVPALVREVTAVLAASDRNLASRVLATGLSGREALTALDQYLAVAGIFRPLVVVDNLQAANVEALASAVGMVDNFDWLVLGHPGDALRMFAALTGASSQTLAGWTEAAVAAEASAAGLRINSTAVSDLRRVTEGNPLFVRSIIRLALTETGGDLEVALQAIGDGTHLTRTDQERLLARVMSQVSERAKQLAALIGLSDLPLGVRIVDSMAATGFGYSSQATRAGLRELVEWSVVDSYQGERVRLRDSFGPNASDLRADLPPQNLRTAVRSLADWANSEAKNGTNQLPHLLLYLRLLPAAGDLSTLVDIATSDGEFFIEVGFMPELRRILTDIAKDLGADSNDRFHTLDTLAFWATHEGALQEARDHIEAMRTLLIEPWASADTICRWQNKVLLLAGRSKDWPAAQAAANWIIGSPEIPLLAKNIARHNLAYAAFQCGKLVEAEALAERAAMAYFDVLDLDPSQLVFTSLEDTARAIGEDRLTDGDVKRLADALELLATIRVSRGTHPLLGWMHAQKLFILSRSYPSAVRVGTKIIEHMISFGDANEARRTMEGFMLPVVRDLRLTHLAIPVRSQYAVVLAYTGDTHAARSVLADLRPYMESAPDDVRMEVESRVLLVEEIAAGRKKLPPLVPIPDGFEQVSELSSTWTSAPGRSEYRQTATSPSPSRQGPCPCGSGRKFKRCCGKQER